MTVHMCIYIYIYKLVCVYVCMRVLDVFMHARMNVCMHVHVSTVSYYYTWF